MQSLTLPTSPLNSLPPSLQNSPKPLSILPIKPSAKPLKLHAHRTHRSPSILLSSHPQAPPSSRGGAGDGDAMGLLFRERIVFLGDEIDDFVADAVIGQLMLLDARDHKKDIKLFINSPGGSLSATMAIFDIVKHLRSDISTIAIGMVASTASLILGVGTKGKRFAMPNTRMMIHQPFGGAHGQVIDVEIQAREVLHDKNNVTRIISEFSGRSIGQVEKDIDRDRYMSPMEAVEYGLIDGVIDRDTIISLAPEPDRVKSTLNNADVTKDPRKFLTSK